MRITALAKRETRERILASARRLFDSQGFARTATRDLARAAGIATGTLFNYFASKEALAMTLAAEALERGRAEFRQKQRPHETLEEALFGHIAFGLRELDPYRHFLGEVFETALSPFSRSSVAQQGEELRLQHLETVAELLRAGGLTEEPNFVSMHLYWTLYLGVLAFWSRDASENQSETLVVLDQSLKLFVGTLRPTEEA